MRGGPAFFAAQGGGASPTAPLDAYASGMFSAVALRQLLSSYSGALVNVRRDSDNATTDIGFVAGGSLDTATLATWGGSASVYVVTWYDQSGNGNNLTQATSAAQPVLVNAGTYLGSLLFDGSNDTMQWVMPNGVMTVSAAIRFAYATLPSSGVASVLSNAHVITAGYNGFTIQYQQNDGHLHQYMSQGTSYQEITTTVGTSETGNVFIETIAGTSSQARYLNGAFDGYSQAHNDSLVGPFNNGNPLFIGSTGSGQFANIKFKALALWSVDKSSNATSISAAI